jgi:hypothetical protein
VERSHRIDAEGFYGMLDGLDGQIPYGRLRQKTTTPPA